jgi:hypothetical protein
MEWYITLTRKQKANIRCCFEACTGMTLNQALLLFTFSEYMDILVNKLRIEGFKV